MGIPTPYKFARFTADGNATAITWPGGRVVIDANNSSRVDRCCSILEPLGNLHQFTLDGKGRFVR